MNNLTTRKIVLGLLMALVLAFSVQGTADAIDGISITSPSPADLGTLVAGNNITLTVGIVQSVDSNADGNSDTIHYDQEAITISVSGGGAKITTVGTTTGLSVDSRSLQESPGTTLTSLPRTVSVTISTSSHGEVTVTVTDSTPNADIESGDSRAGSAVLTVYAVRPVWQVSRTATLTLRGITNGVGDGFYDGNDQPIYNGDRNHYQVNYQVFGSDVTSFISANRTNSGGVYVKEGNRPSSPTASNNLTTSSGAQVYLDIGGGSKIVIANVVGTDGDAMSQGIYIFQNPALVVSAATNTNQEGSPGTVIATPFTVTVQDGSGTGGVPGVPVKFDVRNKSTTTGGTLVFNAGLTGELIDARNMDLTATSQAGSTIYVRTGARGVAQIDFQLGSASGDQLVDVSAVGFTRTLKAKTTVLRYYKEAFYTRQSKPPREPQRL